MTFESGKSLEIPRLNGGILKYFQQSFVTKKTAAPLLIECYFSA